MNCEIDIWSRDYPDWNDGNQTVWEALVNWGWFFMLVGGLIGSIFAIIVRSM